MMRSENLDVVVQAIRTGAMDVWQRPVERQRLLDGVLAALTKDELDRKKRDQRLGFDRRVGAVGRIRNRFGDPERCSRP